MKVNGQPTMNPGVDKYLLDGCMRCKYGGTPQCKVNYWRVELEALRQIVLETGLNEEVKWRVPVYTHKGKNVLVVSALKDYAAIGFLKGALIGDTEKMFSQEGNAQSSKYVRYTDVDSILKSKEVLKAYIAEAMALEKSGKKVKFKKHTEPLPVELLQAFGEDPSFEKAFHALTPGRQRGYLIHFSEAKQSKTRARRIAKNKQQIFEGVGLHDKYSC